MNKDYDGIFCFSGNYKTGFCRVRSFQDKKYALITEIYDNVCYIENNIRVIHSELLSAGIIGPQTVMIEHHEGDAKHRESFESVSLGSSSSLDEYNRLSFEQTVSLLNCDATELRRKTPDIPHFQRHIRLLKTGQNPTHDNPYVREIYWRQERNKVFLRDLSQMVASGSGERALQCFLEDNLASFASGFAKPQDEFIVFPRTHLGSKRVPDFIVFSGRSTMQVTIIEIKGADFSLAQKKGYKHFKSGINDAKDQQTIHQAFIADNKNAFSQYAHKLRKEVEQGSYTGRAVSGCQTELMVSEEKGVNCWYSIIGGRRDEDLRESQLRHRHEGESGRLTIDSWESWIDRFSL